MKVLAYDPYVKELPEEFRSYVTLCSENEVISGCDFLSLHLPLNDETRNMISAPQLASMKAGAYVINAARGGIVNEKDLYEALVSGHIAGAAMDVSEVEPMGGGKSPADPGQCDHYAAHRDVLQGGHRRGEPDLRPERRRLRGGCGAEVSGGVIRAEEPAVLSL